MRSEHPEGQIARHEEKGTERSNCRSNRISKNKEKPLDFRTHKANLPRKNKRKNPRTKNKAASKTAKLLSQYSIQFSIAHRAPPCQVAKKAKKKAKQEYKKTGKSQQKALDIDKLYDMITVVKVGDFLGFPHKKTNEKQQRR